MTSEFDALHQLKVRGFATAEAVAVGVGGHAQEAETVLRGLESDGLVKYREGRVTGFSLTADGRARHAELRDAALTGDKREKLSAAYEGFLAPNRAFKQLTTDWQTREDGSDPAPLLDRLQALHAELGALLSTAAEGEPRFGLYEPRFAAALARLRDGDDSAFARPMSDSYHDVWMELHEDLLSSLGHERTEADE
jgi:DNA-binding PadR family transcriptional regulator